MQTIKEFLNREAIKEIKSHTLGENMEQDFFRDPLRTIFYNPNLFYAPADGVVLYAKEMEADEPYEIKGAKFTLKEMLDNEDYKDRSLVVGIFMTALNVHVNRVPSSCYYLNVKETNPLQTHGVSMIVAENNLLEDFKIKKQDMGYLVYNEKRISKFYCPDIKGCFYLVQIADRDVDCNLTWRKGQYLIQGDRFGQIRFGSQCELVIPLKKGMNFEILCKPLDMVEAGKDTILAIKEKNK
jgi:phosphatidylserine decarboxylase